MKKRKSTMGKTKGKKEEPEILDMEDIDINDITDSEEEYTETEKSLLEKVRNKRTPEDYDSDVEVYGIQSDKDDDDDEDDDGDEGDSMESDIEGLKEDSDLPNEKAWGKKKRTFYYTDYVDPDYASASHRDLAEAEIEEQEAKNIQKRLAEQLDDADFGLEFVQPAEDTKEQEDTEQVIQADLTKLSKRQQQVIMQRESPEFASLVNDFKDRMTEASDILAPFLKLVDRQLIPACPAVSFVKTKYHLSLNYCVNISFYLMLKAKRLPVNSHPVIKRLAQYRQLLVQLDAGQGKLMDEIRDILNAEKAGKPLYKTTDGSMISTIRKKDRLSGIGEKTKKNKKTKSTPVSELSEDAVKKEELLEDDNEFDLENMEVEESEDNEDVEEAEAENAETTEDPLAESEGKRAITYQMAKNRGLTPYRKKELRNPRVKHRNKYRKAKIRRKGAVREVRKELTRYAGEISGIKAGVKKGIKLK